jgi:hypothetical protein
MSAKQVSRRAALTAFSLSLPALLAACGGQPVPTTFPPLRWDYLPRLRLNVASLTIEDAWTPNPNSRERGFLAPTPPLQALRQMAEDRLAAVGTAGKAEFVIDDASIVEQGPNYVGTFAVHLSIFNAAGQQVGSAEARVFRTANIGNDSPAGVRAELYTLVQRMMADMNVEFEYEVRRSLHAFLVSAVAPPPAPVEQQPLAPVTPATPAAAAPSSLSPPPAAPSAPPPITPPLVPALTPAAPAAAPAAPAAVPFTTPGPTPLVR